MRKIFFTHQKWIIFVQRNASYLFNRFQLKTYYEARKNH